MYKINTYTYGDFIWAVYLIRCNKNLRFFAKIRGRQIQAIAFRLIHPVLLQTLLPIHSNDPSFIAKRFCQRIKDLYSHVRNKYRTPTELSLLEGFHWTLKEEKMYWRFYHNPTHGRVCLEEFRVHYNTIWLHWALIPQQGGDPITPHDVYVEGKVTAIPKWQGWANAGFKKDKTE